MSLVPNRTTREVLDQFEVDSANFVEGIGSITVETGWHDDPAGSDPIIIEQKRIVRNSSGRILRQDEEQWIYEVHGAPPMEYTRNTYGRVYLPEINTGRNYMLLETEHTNYYPWTAFMPGSANLSRKRTISGYVIYDIKPQSAALSAEARAKLVERGINPDGPANLIVDSARTWQEAGHNTEVVESDSAPQTAVWVDPVETEMDLVFAEVDKWTSYTVRQNHLKPGDVTVSEPRHQRKESWTYRLTVPVDPPDITAQMVGNEVQIEVTGGGATITYSTGEEYTIHPDRYRVLRRISSEPARAASGDPWDAWETDPAASNASTLWSDDSVTDLSGAPADPLPSQTAYTEPGDASEPTVEGWVVIATVDNDAERSQPGHAAVTDDDVVQNGVYEYRATAIIGQDESVPSSLVTVTYTGTTTSSMMRVRSRTAEDGSTEIDVLAPDDVNLPSLDYGETVLFTVPAAVYDPAVYDAAGNTEPGDEYEEADYTDPDTLGGDIGRRQFARNRQSRLKPDVELTCAIAVLERGQRVKLPETAWKIMGNDLQLNSSVDDEWWLLDSFRLDAKRSSPTGELDTTRARIGLIEP